MVDEIITNVVDAIESYYVVGADNIEGLNGLIQTALTSIGQAETATLSDNITPIKSDAGKKTVIAKIQLVENGAAVNNVTVVSTIGAIAGGAACVDANLSTNGMDTQATLCQGVFDFQTNINRSATIQFGGNTRTSGSQNCTITVELSQDNVNWNTVYNQVIVYPRSNSVVSMIPLVVTASSTFRYVRTNQTCGVDNFANNAVRMHLFEIYDPAFPIDGGTGHTVDIRASDTLDTADGVVLKTVIVDPETSSTIDEFLVVPSNKFLTFVLTVFGTSTRRNILANQIITEEFTGI